MTASIAVLTSAADGSYYTAALPSNYYIGENADRARGHWWGPLAETLGLSGAVGSKEFSNLLEGKHPGTERRLTRGHTERVPGIDLTFSAPKSVSSIYAVCDERTRKEIEQCQRDAVGACLQFIQENLLLFRSGRGGGSLHYGTICAALFQHLVNRNGDPSLHTHAVIPNIAKNENGKWQAVHTKALFDIARVIGPMYRASLAKGLRTKLGFELEVPNTENAKRATWFEVKGVPKSLLKHWSTRKSEIDDALLQNGATRDSASPQFRAEANKKTRHSKDRLPHIDVLHDKWHRDAKEHGFSASSLRQPVALAENKVATGTRLRSAITESIKELTAQSAHFKYSDLLRFVAEKLQDVGIHPKELKSKLDKSIARSRSLIRLEGEGLDLKLTTKSHWKIEESLLKDAEKLLELRGAVVSKSTTSNVVQERSTLSKEQAIAVEGLTRAKGSIRLLQGSAGAGKTFTLDTVREAFEKSGYKVIGGAVSGLAKEALRNDAQIETNTVAYYLKRIENLRAAGSTGKSKRLFDSKTVLVLDEASMIDAKGMQKLLAEVRKSKATVILVGDERQLQAIGAGGPFKFLLQSIKPVTLTENRRQANADDRKAVTLVRAGKVKEALESYLKRGRLTVGETRADAAKCLVQAWADAGGSCNPRAHSIFTETRKESAYLNRLCQQIRVQENISDSLLKARLGDTDFYKGDRILFQKADKSLGIENGFRGEVTAINPSRNTITVLLDTPKPGMPKRVTLSLNGKASEDISLGYAATTHKMQGQTTDHAYVFVGGGLSDRAMTYTQLTRGRHTTNLFVDEANAGKNLTTLARSMTRDRTKTLAHEHRNESQTHSFT